MRFATFYKNSTGYVEGNYSGSPRFSPDHVKPIPALGGDGVIVFDGRWSIDHCVDVARNICINRKLVGFTIEQGESFTRSRIIRKLELVTQC